MANRHIDPRWGERLAQQQRSLNLPKFCRPQRFDGEEILPASCTQLRDGRDTAPSEGLYSGRRQHAVKRRSLRIWDWRGHPTWREGLTRKQNSLQLPELAYAHAWQLEQLIWVGPERCLYCVDPVTFKEVLEAPWKYLVQGQLRWRRGFILHGNHHRCRRRRTQMSVSRLPALSGSVGAGRLPRGTS